jgi:ubiquinone/menaquinone biosynthesis C-methylase UbiE
MPDVYATITEADASVLELVAKAMEVSAADPQHAAMVASYVAELDPRPDARLLEIGSGTGAVSRLLSDLLPTVTITGVDPSADLVARARQLGAGSSAVTFEVGDGAAVPHGDGEFDVVVIHRVLCHVPGPERLLREAHRVLRPSGEIAVFDGDYATITLATGPDDPLSSCVSAFQGTYINDPWVVRRLPALVRAAGFRPRRMRSHGVVQVEEPDYLLSVADRGADALASSGRIGPDLAAALKAEARRRVAANEFFGHIAYASLVAVRDP